MFKVKRKSNGEIITVLDTYCEPDLGTTFFLIWDNAGWRWRPADNFVPPNWEEEK